MKVDLGQIILKARQQRAAGNKDAVSIIEFIESPWGLGTSGMSLYPVQRIILKAHYGLSLDDCEHEGVDIDKPIPHSHPDFEEIAGSPERDGNGNLVLDENGKTIHFYKFRVTVSNWKRKNTMYLTEAGYLRHLFEQGRSNIAEVIPGDERRLLVLSLGRRSGKSFMASCILAYEVYKLILKEDPQSYYGVPAGDDIQLITVATGKDQAKLLYNKVSAHFNNSPFFSPYWANRTQSYARFQTPSDQKRYGLYQDDEKAKATINVTFSPAKAKALRGAANIVIIFDEFAHVGETGENSAKSMLDAAGPSRSTFSQKDPNDSESAIGPVEGRIAAISTPMGRQGEFFRTFQAGFQGKSSKDYLCIQAPTWEVNPTVPAEEFETFYVKDPVVFETEYGASFTDRTRGWITDEQDLLACVQPDLKMKARGVPRTPYFVGFDLGLVGDGSGVAIGHIEQRLEGPIIVVDYVDWIKAGEGKYEDYNRLEFDDVADWLHDLSKRFMFSEGLFDRHSGIVLEQALIKRGLKALKMEAFTPQKASEIYENFKHLMWAQKIALYNDPIPEGEVFCEYLAELLELQEIRVSKHVARVEAPNTRGKHDDRSDALARMIWLASQQLSNPHYFAKGGIRGGRGPRRGVMRGSRGELVGGGSSPDRQFFKKKRGW